MKLWISSLGVSAILSFALFGPNDVWAHDDERILTTESSKRDLQSLDPSEAFRRTEAVLRYFGVPAESGPGDYLLDLQGKQSLEAINRLLPLMDPLGIFRGLMNISITDLMVFQDPDSRKVTDFEVGLKTMKEIPFPKRPFSLRGLRVALDPGHMGGGFWDRLTGKYVHDSYGNIVSEGVIALQTCLLLKAELEQMGAVVMITHSGFGPVTAIDYPSFDIRPFALNELRESTQTPWFQTLLNVGPPGPALFQAFQNSPERKRLFSASSRDDYFIKRADLWARADLIERFNPDLVLIVHFDTAEPPGDETGLNPKAPKWTKAFVVGGYEANEFASRESRKFFARHLLDQKSWDLSVELSRAIVHQFKQQLRLDLAPVADLGSTLVEPGIFARNLGIPRRLRAPAISYLECLFYNRPDEFGELLKADHVMWIDGKKVTYSRRLVTVKNAIRDGILNFVQSHY